MKRQTIHLEKMFTKKKKILQRICKVPGGTVMNLPANSGEEETWIWFPEEGNGNPLQYSCRENSTEWRVWHATVHGVAKSQTLLSDWAHMQVILTMQ